MSFTTYEEACKELNKMLKIIKYQGNKLNVISLINLIEDNKTAFGVGVSTLLYQEIAFLVLLSKTDTTASERAFDIGVITNTEMDQNFSIMTPVIVDKYNKITKLHINPSRPTQLILDIKNGDVEIFIRRFNSSTEYKHPEETCFICKIADVRGEDFVYDFTDEMEEAKQIKEVKTFATPAQAIVHNCLFEEDIKKRDKVLGLTSEILDAKGFEPEIWLEYIVKTLKEDNTIPLDDLAKTMGVVSRIYDRISKDYFGE